MWLYLCSSMGSITSAFSWKILGQKEQGGIIRLLASQVSWQKSPLWHHKYLNVQPLHPFNQRSWYRRGSGSWDDPRTSQKSPSPTLRSVFYDETDWTKMLLMSRIYLPKAWSTNKIYLNKKYSVILFRDIIHYQQSEKERIIQVLFGLFGMVLRKIYTSSLKISIPYPPI